ncbi:hypothetical protein VTK73DRAFT_3648 [Phialemonium thermophilum]|uniref:Uncharacterized protein n=1 Tax=Phialemonium thermophilum TaxID=223376 RepID=A0ABR3WYH6_9PEZI
MGQNLSDMNVVDTSKDVLSPTDRFADILLGIFWAGALYACGIIFCARLRAGNCLAGCHVISDEIAAPRLGEVQGVAVVEYPGGAHSETAIRPSRKRKAGVH